MGIVYSVHCDFCMHEFAYQDDRCPDVSTITCDECGQEYCDECPEKLSQCKECGQLYCGCMEFTGSGCKNCSDDDD